MLILICFRDLVCLSLLVFFSGASSIFFGGYPPAPSRLAITEEYDGTTWATGGDVNSGRHNAGMNGTQNAAIMAAGQTPTAVTCTEEWDGSS